MQPLPRQAHRRAQQPRDTKLCRDPRMPGAPAQGQKVLAQNVSRGTYVYVQKRAILSSSKFFSGLMLKRFFSTELISFILALWFA